MEYVMKLNKFSLAICASVLGGCQTTTHPIEAKLRADDTACQAYGFRYGSQDYIICRKRRDSTFLQENLGGRGVIQDISSLRLVLEPHVITTAERLPVP